MLDNGQTCQRTAEVGDRAQIAISFSNLSISDRVRVTLDEEHRSAREEHATLSPCHVRELLPLKTIDSAGFLLVLSVDMSDTVLSPSTLQLYPALNSIRGINTTLDSLFGDVPELDSRKAAEAAADREKWKSPRPSKRW